MLELQTPKGCIFDENSECDMKEVVSYQFSKCPLWDALPMEDVETFLSSCLPLAGIHEEKEKLAPEEEKHDSFTQTMLNSLLAADKS